MTARLRRVLAAAMPIALVLAVACGSSAAVDEPEQQGHHTETDAHGLPIAHVAVRYASAYAANLDTLVASTDAVFVGEVVGVGEQRELTFGDTNRGVPITTYVVRVEESDGAAEPGSTVEVEQMGGVVRNSEGEDVRVVLEFDSPMLVGDRYLFIANEEGGTYTASAFARFPIENGRVATPGAWSDTGASQELTGKTVAEAMEKVADVDR